MSVPDQQNELITPTKIKLTAIREKDEFLENKINGRTMAWVLTRNQKQKPTRKDRL